ncbi:spore-associated protein [Nocardiopsis sp. NPDC101807]|uniref:spore-associated protein n=1 Tax=Nocardiopsis sp. NPDC101807 TaxID=3364339 RepID=UPI003804ABC4
MSLRRKRARRTWAGAAVVAAAVLVMSSATAAQGADPVALCNANSPDGALTYSRNAAGWPKPLPNGQGSVYLYYESATGYNCAVTVGNGGYADVGLRRSDGAGAPQWRTGSGTAGPVYVQAEGVCVDVSGAVGDRSATWLGTNCGA